MRGELFDNQAFWIALENTRISRNLSWRQVAEKSGVSASTLTRISQGKRPDMDSFSALIYWSGLDSQRFVGKSDDDSSGGDALAQISLYLKEDRNLTPEASKILEAMVQAVYQQMKNDNTGE